MTSSVCGQIPFPGNAVYSATKAFVTFMGQSLNYELKDRIDVLSYAPAAVSTKLIGKKSTNNENL